MADSSSFLVSDLIASVTELSGGRLPSRPMHGAEAIRVEGFRPIEEADSAHIAFVSNPKALKEAAASGAAVLVVPDAAEESLSKLEDFARPVVFTPNPYAWYAWASQAMEGGAFPEPESGIDLRAVIAADAEIDPSARVDAGAVIGFGAKIGPFVWIGEGAYVGAKTEIGEHTHLFPQAKVGDHCHVGRRVIINMGATIGGEGFGFAPFSGEWIKIPQVGGVTIGDDVEIGANSTIDRGALDDTVVGNGTKIDDQVQIGHNCRIGSHCVICGCVGIAGSTTVGDHCVLGGAAMINGHITIPAGSMVGPATPIVSWDDKPEVMIGIYPAQPRRESERTAVLVRNLTDMRKTLKSLEREIAALKAARSGSDES